MIENVVQIIKDLQATNSRLDKESIINDAYIGNNSDFFKLMQLCYDSLVTFGVKKVPERKKAKSVQVHALFQEEETTVTINDFYELADDLKNRKLTGHAARDAIQLFADACDEEAWNYVLKNVLLKDMRSGFTATTVNNVLSKHKGTEHLLVPIFEAQLAKDVDDHVKKIENKKVITEIKLDGVRILAAYNKDNGSVTIHTRNGLINENFTQIEESIRKALSGYEESVVLDGEVMSSNFQAQMRQINRKNNVDTSDSILHLFDVIPLDDFMNGFCSQDQGQRRDKLVELFNERLSKHPALTLLEQFVFDLRTQMDEYEQFKKDAVASGFEGIMIKAMDAPYESGKGTNWMKWKPVLTVDLKIVGFEEGTKKNTGKLGAFLCEGYHDGKFVKVKVGSGMEESQRLEFWLNKESLLDVTLEIECDCLTQNQDDANVYSLRFPRMVRFRYDK